MRDRTSIVTNRVVNYRKDWAARNRVPYEDGPIDSMEELSEISNFIANAFCATGKGGGIKPNCPGPGGGKGGGSKTQGGYGPKGSVKAAGKPHDSKSKATRKKKITGVQGHDKKTGTDTKAGGLDRHTEVAKQGLVDKLTKMGASAVHAKHVVTAYAKDKIGATVAKLPGPIRAAVEKSYLVGAIGGKAAFASWTAGQALAERVAKERGMTPESAQKLRGVLKGLDMTTMKPLAGALASTGIGAAAVGGASMIPPATAAYLAYSTARNPLATVRAAKGLIGDAIKSRKTAKPKNRRRVKNDSTTDVNQLVTTLDGYNWDDWFIALLQVALDQTGDLQEAIKEASAAYEANPQDPSDGQDTQAAQELMATANARSKVIKDILKELAA